jgi:retron-type reverse transcriptase
MQSINGPLQHVLAFDKVWHAELLYKLRQALPLKYFLLLKSYLHNRHFRVKVGNDYSELTSIHAGIPQGSVLGPLLYLLYTADLPTSPRYFIATFADDTSIFTTDSDPAVASHLLQTDLLEIQHWLDNNNIDLRLNIGITSVPKKVFF